MGYKDSAIRRARDRERFRKRTAQRSAKGLCPAMRPDPAGARAQPGAKPAPGRGMLPAAPGTQGSGQPASRGEIRKRPRFTSANETAGRPESGAKPACAFDAARSRPPRSAPDASRASRNIVRPTGPATRRARRSASCMAGAMSSGADGPPASEAASVSRPAGRRASVCAAAGTARSRAARFASPAARRGESGNGSCMPSGEMPASAGSVENPSPTDRAARAAFGGKPARRRKRPITPGAAGSTCAAG